MSVEWIVTGIILLGAMAFGGINLYLRKKGQQMEGTDDVNDMAEEKNDFT